MGESLKSSKYLKLKKISRNSTKRLIKISGLYPRKAIYLLGKTDILTCRQLISALPPTVSEIAKMIDFFETGFLTNGTYQDQRGSQVEKNHSPRLGLILGPSWFRVFP